MADTRAAFEALCPRVVEHPRFGSVAWNRRCATYVAYRKALGQPDNVPVLIRAPRGASTKALKALLDRAWKRLVELETRAAEVFALALADFRELQPKGDGRELGVLTLGSVELIDDGDCLVTWYFNALRTGASAAIQLDRHGTLRSHGLTDAGAPVRAPNPVADWVVALPARVPHPVLGDLVLSIESAQYVALHGGEEPELYRIDLPALEVSMLPAHLDACAAVFRRIQSSFDDAMASAEVLLESWRAKRDLPPLRRKREWIIFLEDGTILLLLENAMPEDEASDDCFFNVSLHFDSTGTMTAVTGTTEAETCCLDVPPPPRPEERVVHKKFGAGAVIAVIEAEKVRVRFDDGTERVLHRSFLTSD